MNMFIDYVKMQGEQMKKCKMCKDVFGISLKMRGCQTYENLYLKDTNSYMEDLLDPMTANQNKIECSKARSHTRDEDCT